MTDDQKITTEILGEEFAQAVVKELGIENDTPEAQTRLIEMLGQNVIERIALEIYKILPREQHQTFDGFMGTGDLIGLRAFLLPHIPDLDAFIQHHASKEYEATKTRAHQIMQGVE